MDPELSAAVAAAVGRVLDINPVLLRPDTPLDHFGCDSVALMAIVDVLAEGGIAVDPASSPQLAKVVTFADLVDVVAGGR